jgi:hypothetical protein
MPCDPDPLSPDPFCQTVCCLQKTCLDQVQHAAATHTRTHTHTHTHTHHRMAMEVPLSTASRQAGWAPTTERSATMVPAPPTARARIAVFSRRVRRRCFRYIVCSHAGCTRARSPFSLAGTLSGHRLRGGGPDSSTGLRVYPLPFYGLHQHGVLCKPPDVRNRGMCHRPVCLSVCLSYIFSFFLSVCLSGLSGLICCAPAHAHTHPRTDTHTHTHAHAASNRF